MCLWKNWYIINNNRDLFTNLINIIKFKKKMYIFLNICLVLINKLYIIYYNKNKYYIYKILKNKKRIQI